MKCSLFTETNRVTSGACAQILSRARKDWASLRRSGAAGRPAIGTYGRPVSLSVVRHVERNGRACTQTIWQDGRALSGAVRCGVLFGGLGPSGFRRKLSAKSRRKIARKLLSRPGYRARQR